MAPLDTNQSTTRARAAGTAIPFYLTGTAGRLCALYYSPTPPCKGHYLYLHPFTQELYNSRPIVASLLRQFARDGMGILSFDMFGCGDSDGDFREARWEIWEQDVERAAAWVRENGGPLTGLIGLRLGALLATEVAERVQARRLMLWQPVLDGEQMINEFLRLRVAFSGMRATPESKLTTGALRARLSGGEPVEVAGYDLDPALVSAMASLRLRAPADASQVWWLHFSGDRASSLPVPVRQLTEQWKAAGTPLEVLEVAAKPFWVHTRGNQHDYVEASHAISRLVGGS